MADNPITRRAKVNLPTVILTMLSIVQALALELMWSHLSAQPYLYEWTFAAFLGWAQIATNLLGILLIWLIYSSLVMRFAWVPTTTDSVFPFLVGIVEFAQINLLGLAKIGPWFIVMSGLFAAMVWISQVSMKRARLDEDNHEYFTNVRPASSRDLMFSMIPVAFLFCLGALLWITQNQGWFALIAVFITMGLLGYQLRMNHVFTMRSYQSTPEAVEQDLAS